MGYRLWFGEFDSINLDTDLIPAQLDMFGGEVKKSAKAIFLNGRCEFNIEDIDAFTTYFNNEEEFRMFLISISSIDDSDLGRVILTHKYKELREDFIVYNNSLLRKCAVEVQNKKKNGFLDSDIWLEKTEEIVSFARGITRYLSDDDKREELLELGLAPGLYNGLISYSDSTSREDDSFIRIVNGCLKYRDLRKLIVWEEKQRTLRGKMMAQIIDEDIKNRELRVSPIKNPLIEEVYNTRGFDGDVDWDQVFNCVSADDLFRREHFEDLQRVGYFKSYETRKTTGYDGRS